MNFRVVYTSHFEKEANRLSKKYPSLTNDILDLIEQLKTAPEQGTSLGKGLYKVRLAIESKGKGKSGGARVITYLVFSQNIVYLTAIYDKSEQDNVKISVLIKLLQQAGLSE